MDGLREEAKLGLSGNRLSHGALADSEALRKGGGIRGKAP